MKEITFQEVEEHIVAGDLKEWANVHHISQEEETFEMELTEEGKENLRRLVEEIGPGNPFDEDIESITVEDRENGRTRKFYPEETVRAIQEVAIELLDRFREEKQKQIAAMRMAAASSYERDQAKRKQAKLEKEVARYWKILESIGD